MINFNIENKIQEIKDILKNNNTVINLITSYENNPIRIDFNNIEDNIELTIRYLNEIYNQISNFEINRLREPTNSKFDFYIDVDTIALNTNKVTNLVKELNSKIGQDNTSIFMETNRKFVSTTTNIINNIKEKEEPLSDAAKKKIDALDLQLNSYKKLIDSENISAKRYLLLTDDLGNYIQDVFSIQEIQELICTNVNLYTDFLTLAQGKEMSLININRIFSEETITAINNADNFEDVPEYLKKAANYYALKLVERITPENRIETVNKLFKNAEMSARRSVTDNLIYSIGDQFDISPELLIKNTGTEEIIDEDIKHIAGNYQILGNLQENYSEATRSVADGKEEQLAKDFFKASSEIIKDSGKKLVYSVIFSSQDELQSYEKKLQHVELLQDHIKKIKNLKALGLHLAADDQSIKIIEEELNDLEEDLETAEKKAKEQLDNMEDIEKSTSEMGRQMKFFKGHILITLLMLAADFLSDHIREMMEQSKKWGESKYKVAMADAQAGLGVSTFESNRIANWSRAYSYATYGMIDFDEFAEFRNKILLNGRRGGFSREDADYLASSLFSAAKVTDTHSEILDLLNLMQFVEADDSATAAGTVHSLIQVAQQSNVNIKTYLSTASSLGRSLRDLGVPVTNTIGQLKKLTLKYNFRIEDTKALISSMASKISNLIKGDMFSEDGVGRLYVASILSGERLSYNWATDVKKAMLSHDKNGNPMPGYYNRMSRMYKSLIDHRATMAAMQGSKMGARDIAMALSGEGFSSFEIAQIHSAYMNHEEEKLNDLFLAHEKGKEKDPLLESTQQFDEALIDAGEQLSETQKKEAVKMQGYSEAGKIYNDLAKKCQGVFRTYEGLIDFIANGLKSIGEIISKWDIKKSAKEYLGNRDENDYLWMNPERDNAIENLDFYAKRAKEKKFGEIKGPEMSEELQIFMTDGHTDDTENQTEQKLKLTELEEHARERFDDSFNSERLIYGTNGVDGTGYKPKARYDSEGRKYYLNEKGKREFVKYNPFDPTTDPEIIKMDSKRFKSLDKKEIEKLKTMKLYERNAFEVINSDTEEGRIARKFLEDNKIDISNLKDKEKQIFKDMCKKLAKGRITLAQCLLILVKAIDSFKIKDKNPYGGFGYHNPEIHKVEDITFDKLTYKEIAENLEYYREHGGYTPDNDGEYWELWLQELAARFYEEAKSALNEDGTFNERKLSDEARDLLRQFYNAVKDMHEKMGSEPGDRYHLDSFDGIIEKVESKWAEKGRVNESINETFKYLASKNINRKNLLNSINWKNYQISEEFFGEDAYNRNIKKAVQLKIDHGLIKKDSDKPNLDNSKVAPQAGGYFPQDAIEQAKMVSAKTGIPVDYILAFFYLESNGAWEVSEKMHNYGNTVQPGSLGTRTFEGGTYGVYATTEEGAEALAEYTRFFSIESSRAAAKAAAEADDPAKFVWLMKQAGYFEDTVEHYLQLFRSGLAIARGKGLTGVSSGGINSGRRANFKFNRNKLKSRKRPANWKELKEYQKNVMKKLLGTPIEIKGQLVGGRYVVPNTELAQRRKEAKPLLNERQNRMQPESSSSRHDNYNNLTQQQQQDVAVELQGIFDGLKMVDEALRKFEEQIQEDNEAANVYVYPKGETHESIEDATNKILMAIDQLCDISKTNYVDSAAAIS